MPLKDLKKNQALKNVEALQAKIKSTQHERSILATALQFQKWCADRNWIDPFPVKVEPLGAFIVDKVRLLKGSAKSAGRWLNQLRNYSIQHRFPWLDATDEKNVKRIIKELEFLDAFPIKRMHPLTKDINLAILSHPQVPFLAKTYITVGREAILRGGELCSGLTRANFTWSLKKDRVTIHLFRSKANRKGDGEFITLLDYGVQSSVSILKEHFNIHGLWKAQPDKIIFPAYTKTKGMDWNKSINVRQLRDMIRRSLKCIGMDGNRFGAHSLRAGGATDLFRAGVYYPTIKKFGRWKSDSALLYFRDQEKTVETVMEAFAN